MISYYLCTVKVTNVLYEYVFHEKMYINTGSTPPDSISFRFHRTQIAGAFSLGNADIEHQYTCTNIDPENRSCPLS